MRISHAALAANVHRFDENSFPNLQVNQEENTITRSAPVLTDLPCNDSQVETSRLESVRPCARLRETEHSGRHRILRAGDTIQR